jgi:hypothetical protein
MQLMLLVLEKIAYEGERLFPCLREDEMVK